MLPTNDAVLSFLQSIGVATTEPHEATFRINDRYNVGFLRVKSQHDGHENLTDYKERHLIMLFEVPLRLSEIEFVERLSDDVHYLKPEGFNHSVTMITSVNYDEDDEPYFVLMVQLPDYMLEDGVKYILNSVLDFMRTNFPRLN